MFPDCSVTYVPGLYQRGRLTVLAADERLAEARCARDDETARSRSWRYAARDNPVRMAGGIRSGTRREWPSDVGLWPWPT
jgi:hypothetical protein